MMRLSLAEARKMGLIPESPKLPKGARTKNTKKLGQDPQRMIYDALVRRLGAHEVIYEASGVVPGRRYRADLYLPASRIAVEMDGFQYHSSKSAFQRDRERQNLFALHGILVLRYFTRQVFRDLDGIADQIIWAHESRVAQRHDTTDIRGTKEKFGQPPRPEGRSLREQARLTERQRPLIRYAGSAAETSIGSKPIGS